MIVNRIIKNEFPELTLGGLSSAEVQSRRLILNDIHSPNEVVSDEITVLIYDDLPLLSSNLLYKLAAKCKKKSCGFALGGGFIKSIGFNGNLERLNARETVRLRTESYAEICSEINREIIRFHSKNGVIFPCLDGIKIDFSVRIAEGVTVHANSVIEGATEIASGAVIGRDCVINNCKIAANAIITSSTLKDSSVGQGTTVGPYAYIRNSSTIGANCRIGDFVEIKNSILGDGVKAAHLAYVGDATVGSGTNIGCGTVFCNYDGKSKHRSIIGNSVFIGANTNLIAPITVGDETFIAAGSTVTDDVPKKSFVIARERQTVKIKSKKS